jgi:hypothetical protein
MPACLSQPTQAIKTTIITESPTSISATRSLQAQITPSQTVTVTPSPESILTGTQSFTPTAAQPVECRLPTDDYLILTINGALLNQRTFAMLEHADEIYQGEIEITGYAVTQGSYTSQVSASFGTHSGGGAVDLSVMRSGTYTVLWDEIPPLIRALRLAGFAAWLRDLDELYPGSPIHIHAIAIGDRDLSPAAKEQLTGPYGYFSAQSGLPPEFGGPSPDRFGGPVYCQWMLDLGYMDLRPTPTPYVDLIDTCCRRKQ